MKSAGKFAKQLLIASLVILTSFSVAQAQRGSRGGNGGGRSNGGGGNFGGGGGRSNGGGGGFNGGPRISSAPRGNFGGGNRIAVGPRFTTNRAFGGIRGGISIGPGYNNRGNYGRPYYGGGYGRPGFGGYGAYYRGYFPRIGFYLNVLPFGYYPFSYGGYPYYYNEGLFYQQYNSGYQVVAPPIGAEVPRLPRGTQDINIDGQQYFEKDGVYYQKVIDENGKKAYRVAGKDGVLNTDANDDQDNQQQYNNNTDQQSYNNQAPQQNTNPLPKVGDVVNSIPTDSRAVTINGEKLFISPDGVYYQEDNSGNSRIFKVVGVSSIDNGTDAIAP